MTARYFQPQMTSAEFSAALREERRAAVTEPV
jgi:hypothetical protein